MILFPLGFPCTIPMGHNTSTAGRVCKCWMFNLNYVHSQTFHPLCNCDENITLTDILTNLCPWKKTTGQIWVVYRVMDNLTAAQLDGDTFHLGHRNIFYLHSFSECTPMGKIRKSWEVEGCWVGEMHEVLWHLLTNQSCHSVLYGTFMSILPVNACGKSFMYQCCTHSNLHNTCNEYW